MNDREFFRGGRRRVGAVLLVMACECCREAGATAFVEMVTAIPKIPG